MQQQWQVSQGNVASYATATGNINITTEQMNNQHGVIAAGDVDQSRRTKIGSGGLIAIVVLVLMAAGGTAGVVIGLHNGRGASSDRSTSDAGSIAPTQSGNPGSGILPGT